MLGGECRGRRGFVGRAGRARDEVIEEPQRRPAGRGDAVQEMQRAAAVRFDLAFEHRSHAEVVQDRADPVHVLGRKRRLRREQLVQLSANASTPNGTATRNTVCSAVA